MYPAHFVAEPISAGNQASLVKTFELQGFGESHAEPSARLRSSSAVVSPDST